MPEFKRIVSECVGVGIGVGIIKPVEENLNEVFRLAMILEDDGENEHMLV